VILSTIYFKDGWENIFTETRDMTFYPTEEGEGIVCEFLAMDGAMVTAYGGEKFTAIEKKFAEGGNMLFVLPDRGYTTDDLLRDEEFMRFIAEPAAFGNKSQAARDIRIPKFDFSAEGRIDEKIKTLGITDVFDKDKANFTPLTKSETPRVDEINQGIRISIDENGCEAAGYVQIEGWDGAEIPKLMKFDRPFIFAVFTEDGIPLFTGIVNNPTLS
jgi:serpin B